MLGYESPEDVIGKSAGALLKAARCHSANQNGNGTTCRPEIDTLEFQFRHNGRPVRLEIVRDVTERRRLERQLRESQKMEALGRAVGGVAHDFNNLLTAVMLYCDLLVRELPATGRGHHHAEEINAAARRGAALVRQLLAFARQQVLEPKVLSLNAVLLGMKEMLQRLLGDDIELVTRCSESLGYVKVDPAQIQQVILNLVVNARDAMPAGGTLMIETANVKADAALIRRYDALRPGNCVRLMVADTGRGMDADTLAHVFEPFFTTKEKGRGTGLGLSTVYGIVRQSGGAISIDSNAGKGTRVTILLPCVAKATAKGTAPRKPHASAGGSGTLLLVEADAAIREPAAQLLQKAGYTVLEAGNGFDAMRIICERDAIQLLICDVALPGISGGEVAQRVRAKWPGTPVLYMSGDGDRARTVADADPGAVILQKPFTQATLTRKVRQQLDRRLPGRGRTRELAAHLAVAASAGEQHH